MKLENLFKVEFSTVNPPSVGDKTTRTYLYEDCLEIVFPAPGSRGPLKVKLAASRVMPPKAA